MTTTFHFVRHAAHDNVGAYLAGRSPGVCLGPDGLAQADRLARRMQREPFAHMFASPQERTRQTAQAIAVACNVPYDVCDALDEVNFGTWSGRTFEMLDEDLEWRRWNAARSLGRTPAGETMFDVQVRARSVVEQLRETRPDATHTIVSHADVIKAAIAYYVGLPLDRLGSMEISPASLSTLVIDGWSAKLTRLNETVPE